MWRLAFSRSLQQVPSASMARSTTALTCQAIYKPRRWWQCGRHACLEQLFSLVSAQGLGTIMSRWRPLLVTADCIQVALGRCEPDSV